MHPEPFRLVCIRLLISWCLARHPADTNEDGLRQRRRTHCRNGGRIATGADGACPVPTALKYFAARYPALKYFAAQYFATRYSALEYFAARYFALRYYIVIFYLITFFNMWFYSFCWTFLISGCFKDTVLHFSRRIFRLIIGSLPSLIVLLPYF